MKAAKEAYEEKMKIKPVEDRWEDAQIKAASAKSVIDYAVEQFEEHKGELEESIIKEAEEQIAERRKQIQDFLMSEKDIYLEGIGIISD